MTKKKDDISDDAWNFPNSPWKTRAAFLSWLRSQIRRIWNRHPVKIQYKQSRRYKAPVGVNGKEVWCSNCEICGKQSRDCEVDHKDGGYGFKDWSSFTEWQKRILLVTFNDIRELCPDCHSIVNHQQRYGMSFEVAKVDKEAKAIVDAKLEKQWLLDRDILPASAQANRRKQVFEQLKKERGL